MNNDRRRLEHLGAERTRGAEKPSLLFLHGFLGSSADWRRVAERCAAEYDCFAVNLPGHGDNLPLDSEDYSMESAARAIIALLDAKSIRRWGLVGYSMGGRLALFLSLRYPERFWGALFESASPGLETENERSERRKSDEALAERLLGGDVEAFLREWYELPLFASFRRSPAFEESFRRRRRNEPRGLALSLQEMGTGAQPSLWGELAALRVPSAFVVGERDEKFTALARRMRERCTSAQIAVIRSAGHIPHEENTDEFTDFLLSFFRTHPKEQYG